MMTAHRNLWTLALLASVLTGCAAQARTLEVGPGKSYDTPSAAIAAASDGDTVSIQPGEYFDCAMVKANKLVIQGVGDASKVVIGEKACAGKGLLVISGNDVTVRNLTLARVRVPDGNGAGIRAEGRNLLVEGVRFFNNQNGILTGNDLGSMIIRDSVFERNGTCEAACAHGIYANQLDLLRVEHSRFINTRQGHHIKSRARRTELLGNTIQDGPDGTASYELDVPNGGSVVMRDNTIEKGPKAENTGTMVSIGAEGVTQRTSEITIENNKIRNTGSYDTVFIRNLTATDAMLRGNQITGRVKALAGDGEVTASK